MAREWAYDKRNRENWPFCGVDGEGGNIPDPDALFGTVHRYLLLRAGEWTVENPRGLSFEQCADFLLELPRDRIYVAYFFDYDVTMMIRSLPADRAKRLLDRSKRMGTAGNGAQVMPLDYGLYQLDYLPHKEFKIRKRVRGTEKEYGEWLVISDVGQFFQTSFVTTLEKWNIGTEEEREYIRKGKALRADFTGVTEEIRAYNALEVLLLQQLMHEFRSVCTDTGYVPRKWQGPGYLAAAMLAHHGVARRKDIPIMGNVEFKALANEAYYGGRFETTAVGPIRGPVFQYDINSAYPSILRTLPCLTHGSWRRIRDIPDRGETWFGQVYFDHPSSRHKTLFSPRWGLYNLPVRDKQGNIFYPKEGNGVYWSTELEAAEDAGTTIRFSTGWVYENHCDCQWFDFIDDYYRRRLALGKSNKGYVLKLSGNSIYGKLAQSIGYAPYANPVWAGLIPAGCRAQIIRGYSGHIDDIYMIATDGIFSGSKLDLPTSNILGEWEVTEHKEGIFIVQPGIYYVSDGSVKTRGIQRGRINQRREDFEAAWKQFLATNGLNYTVSVPVDNFITAKQALARGKWGIAGTWEKAEREISFEWATKRDRNLVIQDDRGAQRTVPRIGGRKLYSEGYDRQIGGFNIVRVSPWQRWRDPGLQEKERMEEQPDWVEPLIAGE